MNQRLALRPLSAHSAALLALYGTIFVAVYIAAYVFSFAAGENGTLPRDYLVQLLITLPAVLIFKSIVFYSSGHCHTSFRHVTFTDFTSIVLSTSYATLAIFVLQSVMESMSMLDTRIPYRVLAVDWMLTIGVVSGLRAAGRLSREEFRRLIKPEHFTKVLIIGADSQGVRLAQHLQSSEPAEYMVVGFLDDDVRRQGNVYGGVPVRGRPASGPQIAVDFGASQIFVPAGVLGGDEIRDLMERCAELDVQVKVIPGLDDFLSGSLSLQIRDVDINDLLQRDPVQLDDAEIEELIRDGVVMVTGAGGSIGSEICRQVCKFMPRKLLLLEQAENALFFIDREISSAYPDIEVTPVLADITDAARLRTVFESHRPEVVFHAAAHKHVPMMERNPGEAIKNNVFGTKQLVEFSEEFGVDEFVMISTDKAVNPTSVMGASKQLAERVVQMYAEQSKTKFVVVRFGNVLASNGSVVPLFQEQIRRGGPITVTHPDIERFFMTIPEAAQLVLQAASMGQGGEIFVLDMGEPVRIVDLARDLIRLSGFTSDAIPIVFTGLRPGEKLYEELYFDEEQTLPTKHSKLFAAYHRPHLREEVLNSINRLRAVQEESPDVIRAQLAQELPEYTPEAQIACDAASAPEPVVADDIADDAATPAVARATLEDN